MNRKFLISGALLAALAVMAGAFGAHALKTRLSPESLQTFETAVRYQFYHALGLLAVGILYASFPGKLMQWAGHLFIAGIIFFSGSLYLLCGLDTIKWIGAVTPVGGLCFIAGWILIAAACARKD